MNRGSVVKKDESIYLTHIVDIIMIEKAKINLKTICVVNMLSVIH